MNMNSIQIRNSDKPIPRMADFYEQESSVHYNNSNMIEEEEKRPLNGVQNLRNFNSNAHS